MQVRPHNTPACANAHPKSETPTRRALLGAAAAVTATLAAVAPSAAAAPAEPDVELLAQAGRFWRTYRTARRLKVRLRAISEAVDDDPEAPPCVAPYIDPEAYRRWTDFRDSRGHRSAYDAWAEALGRAAEAAQAVFATEACTPAGTLAQMRIVAEAALVDEDGAISDIEAFEDGWIGVVIRGLERQAGGVA